MNKLIVDARRIRAAVIDAFESACNPGQADAERKRLFNFVVVGGGPTGVEFAVELADMVHRDLQVKFPLMKSQIKIQLIEAMDKVLWMLAWRALCGCVACGPACRRVCMFVCVRLYLCVCVRERERVCVCVCMCVCI